MHKDVLELLTKRQAGLGYLLTPHKKGGAIANAVGVYAPVEVDTSRVSSTFVISTAGEDRSVDIVRQKGIRLDNYKANPVVLYGHGFGGVQFPIGRSADDDGKLHVTRKENRTEATCFFAQSSWEAMQVFQLVEEKILNCASVHIDPIKATRRYAEDGRTGLDIEECDLLEWSIVDIPCNPEAVRKILDIGKLAERKISKPLEKMLKKHAAQPKGLVQGMSVNDLAKVFPPKKDDEAADDKNKPAGDMPEDKPEVGDEGEDAPEAAQDGVDAETPETPQVGEQAAQQPQQPQDFSQKPGAQLASGIHTAVTGFTQELTQQLAKQENEAITSMANDVIDSLNAVAERCADGYRQAYGQDIPASGAMQQPQQPVDQQEQQMMKRFIDRLTKDVGTPTPKKTEYGIRAIAKGLSDLSMKKSLSPEEVHRLGHWSKRIFELVDEGREQVVKSLQEVPPVAETPKAEQPNLALLKVLEERNEIVKQITSLRTSLAN